MYSAQAHWSYAMASQCVQDLRQVAEDLEKNGFPVSAAVCNQAAARMERMEALIVSMKDQVKSLED